jgi:hypothetical protein
MIGSEVALTQYVYPSLTKVATITTGPGKLAGGLHSTVWETFKSLSAWEIEDCGCVQGRYLAVVLSPVSRILNEPIILLPGTSTAFRTKPLNGVSVSDVRLMLIFSFFSTMNPGTLYNGFHYITIFNLPVSGMECPP